MGRRVPSEAISSGLNRDLGTYPDNKYVRCNKCGHILNSERHRRYPEGSRAGYGTSQPSTTLSANITTATTTINVASTTGFTSSGYIYIYNARSTGASGTSVDRVAYTGIGATTFTGCTAITRAHTSGDTVRGEQTVAGGCPFCGTYLYK